MVYFNFMKAATFYIVHNGCHFVLKMTHFDVPQNGSN